MLFLIHYDRKQAKTVFYKEYDDSLRAQAYEDRLRLELTHNILFADQEIVLLEAANQAQLRKTHAKYLKTEREANSEKLFWLGAGAVLAAGLLS